MQEGKTSFLGRVKKIFRDKVFVSLVIGGLILNGALFIVMMFFVNFDQNTFILHYNVFFGIDKISFNFNENYLELVLVPIGSVIIWLINFIIAFFLYLTFLREQLQYVEVKEGLNDNDVLDNADLKEVYPKVLGSYLLLGNSLVIASVIGFYLLALVLVNNN